MNKRAILLFVLTSIFSTTVHAQHATAFSSGAGRYARMLGELEQQLMAPKNNKVVRFGGRPRTEFVQWIRDHVHVMKAMKYLHPDMTSFLELYLERQTPEGIYYDYYYPLNIRGISKRKQLFDKKFWKEYPEDSIEMHRLPVEADLEYLMVEGVYTVYQSRGDTAFVLKWLPALEKGIQYIMTDSLRWSKKFGLAKRGYTLDTWDFMQLPSSRQEYVAQGGDVQKGIFNIDTSTPMGIMHGDNSGLYAAAGQLGRFNAMLGHSRKSKAWSSTGTDIRKRANALLWNGKYYKHFAEVDPQPPYLKLDQANTLSLSNPYDINRGLPTEAMSQSIIATYRELKDSNKDSSFAEWYGVYPAVKPHFADYLPGSYMNGGVNTIVAGELAKAAFQHGFEDYAIDILHRLDSLMVQYKGDLPVAYTPQGKVDEGIPDSWGQAAVYSAMIEGLAGIVDQDQRFSTVEISPRWVAAGVDSLTVTATYPTSGAFIRYSYFHEPAEKRVSVTVSGNAQSGTLRILLPESRQLAGTSLNGKKVNSSVSQIRTSRYAVVGFKGGPENVIVVSYR